MCLLIVLSRSVPEWPLVVAANRDEWLARPTTAIAVLRSEAPRILGGRDEVAGGTWMATSERGVVAGLTNRPPGPAGRLARRSRGELPLFLAQHENAALAVEAFARTFHPADYNPCWLLIGDRDSLYYLDMTGGEGENRVGVQELPPGLHILENRELNAQSPKTGHVRKLLSDIAQRRGPELVSQLATVLRNHEIPEDANDVPREDGFVRLRATEAACVHAGEYGTRSSSIVLVPREPGARPIVHMTSSRSCEAPFEDASVWWNR